MSSGGCGFHRHATERDALMAYATITRRMRKHPKSAENLRVVHCRECDKWHIVPTVIANEPRFTQ